MKPIRIVDHDPAWPAAFAAERTSLSARLDDIVLECHHVGSTAVPGLAAEPKIDIDAVVGEHLLCRAIELASDTYAWHGDPYGVGMWTFTADRGAHGVRLYLCLPGNPVHRDRILFRDWLRRNAGEAAGYEARLAIEAPHDWRGYSDGKSAFVARLVAQAKLAAAGAGITPRLSTSER